MPLTTTKSSFSHTVTHIARYPTKQRNLFARLFVFGRRRRTGLWRRRRSTGRRRRRWRGRYYYLAHWHTRTDQTVEKVAGTKNCRQFNQVRVLAAGCTNCMGAHDDDVRAKQSSIHHSFTLQCGVWWIRRLKNNFLFFQSTSWNPTRI